MKKHSVIVIGAGHAGVEAARRALQQTAAGLKDVASRCGFGSAEVLRRAFIRELHVAPSAYRARFFAGGRLAS